MIEVDDKWLEAVRAFFERLEQWSRAYPEEVFHPVDDWPAVEKALDAAGINICCVSAANMRHVVENLWNEARLLYETMPEETE